MIFEEVEDAVAIALLQHCGEHNFVVFILWGKNLFAPLFVRQLMADKGVSWY